ncbi:MAG: hypothetical protein HYS08_10170 [Chlamydiae bacterium]|nr:hypothetical protein [Chlamydiota bacterium]MBI3266260.1 hypothetical protein [Chlamydiota bacterium]
MNSFRQALQFLTCVHLGKTEPSEEVKSRALAYFPVIGIFAGVVLVYLDQMLRGCVPLFLANGILLFGWMGLKYSRGLENLLSFSSHFFETLFWTLLKGVILCLVPFPLRWMSLIFMTTFSSGAWAWKIRDAKPKGWEWEDVLWASFICLSLALACGPLGIFVFGVAVALLAMGLRFFKKYFFLFEETMEVSVMVSVMVFRLVLKIL